MPTQNRVENPSSHHDSCLSPPAGGSTSEAKTRTRQWWKAPSLNTKLISGSLIDLVCNAKHLINNFIVVNGSTWSVNEQPHAGCVIKFADLAGKSVIKLAGQCVVKSNGLNDLRSRRVIRWCFLLISTLMVVLMLHWDTLGILCLYLRRRQIPKDNYGGAIRDDSCFQSNRTWGYFPTLSFPVTFTVMLMRN